MEYKFKKLVPSVYVVLSGTIGFKQLEVEENLPYTPKNVQIDLTTLNLPGGTRYITVTSYAAGLESEKSNEVIYVR